MPPNAPWLTMAVDAPRSAARNAATTPAGPAPRTTTSGTQHLLLSDESSRVRQPAQGAQPGHEGVFAASGHHERRQAGEPPADRASRYGEVACPIGRPDDRISGGRPPRRTRRCSSTRTARIRTAARGTLRGTRTSIPGPARRPPGARRAAAARRPCRAGSSGAAWARRRRPRRAGSPAGCASRRASSSPGDRPAGTGSRFGVADRRQAPDRRASGTGPGARRCASVPSSWPPAAPPRRGCWRCPSGSGETRPRADAACERRRRSRCGPARPAGSSGRRPARPHSRERTRLP